MNIWSLEVYCISICIGRVSNKSGANKHPVSSKHIIWYMFFCKFTTPKKTWKNMKKTHTQEKSLRTPDFFQMISSFCHPRGWRFPGSSHERLNSIIQKAYDQRDLHALSALSEAIQVGGFPHLFEKYVRQIFSRNQGEKKWMPPPRDWLLCFLFPGCWLST